MSHLLIRHLEQFGPLPEDEKRALGSLVTRVREIEADQDIVAEGDRPDDCKVILEGFVYRYKLLPRGRRQIMSFQIPGDVVDLQGFLLGEMDHSLGTLTATKVGDIPHDRLLEATERYPRIARALWQSTLIDSAVFREWMVGIGRRSASQRIAHLLCEMSVRLRRMGLVNDGSFELPVTQAEIGDALGLSNVHVNRSIQTLRRKQLITFQGGRVAIHDWKGLKAAGEFESRYLHLGRDGNPSRRTMDSEKGSPEVH
jgi:CRP-like cAMP-binding protein